MRTSDVTRDEYSWFKSFVKTQSFTQNLTFFCESRHVAIKSGVLIRVEECRMFGIVAPISEFGHSPDCYEEECVHKLEYI